MANSPLRFLAIVIALASMRLVCEFLHPVGEPIDRLDPAESEDVMPVQPDDPQYYHP